MPDLRLILALSWDHLLLVLASVLLAALVAVPMGVLLTRPSWQRRARPLQHAVNVAQTVPGLAVIALASVVLGIGWAPALFALFLYGLLPILNNTVAGLSGISPALKEAARGLGLSAAQVFWRLEIPLAMPVILAGVRTSFVVNVGAAALAAEIGAPCLGTLIFQGVGTSNVGLILAGAAPTALLAVGSDLALARLERRWVSPARRVPA